MKSTVITVGIIALAVVAILYVSRPRDTRTPKDSSNALFSSAIGGILSLGQNLLAPTRTPSLTSSATAADKAVANGLPVSATQGNELMTPSFLDGTDLVAFGSLDVPNGGYIV